MEENEPQAEKRCGKCKEKFPATREFFYGNKTSNDGLQSWCKSCHKTHSAKWRKENPEKRRATARKYARENPEKVKKWTRENPEKAYKALRAWHQEHADDQRKRKKKWAQENPEKALAISRKWHKANPEKARQTNERRRTRELVLPVDFTGADWNRAVEYFEGRCAICDRIPEFPFKLVPDHWKPLVLGGGYTVDNIVPMCHAGRGGRGGCNNSKGRKQAEEWLKEKYSEQDVKVILRRIEIYFEWVKENRT